MKEAQELQWRILYPNEAITKLFGVAGLKAALNEFLGIDTGKVRRPRRNLSQAEIKVLKRVFHSSGFFIDDNHNIKSRYSSTI